MANGTLVACITKAPHIVHLKKLENVVYTDMHLPIGFATMHQIGVVGQGEEIVGIGIGRQTWVVLVCQATYHTLDTYHLSPFQPPQVGKAVEQFAIDIPIDVKGGIAVVEKLHVAHKSKSALLDDV